MLVWIDLETTGLDPRKERILEVGAIVTDDNFEEVARFHRVVYWLHDEKDLAEMSPVVRETHEKNGLLEDVAKPSAYHSFEVDEALASFIRREAHVLEDVDGLNCRIVKPQLAGSTISFDREFMRYWLPHALAELHYRNLDVSTLNEIARRHWPTLHATRPNNETKAHRGMADIEESIRVLKHYMKYLVPAVLP